MQELRLEALVELARGLDLGLGAGRRPVVGLVGRVVRGALKVVVPLLGPVAVGVDAVMSGVDHAVAVDVAQVLAPQARALGGEGVVVAVGVHHGDEPDLVGAQQLLDVAVASVVDEPREEPAVDLGRDPLACVLGGLEERDRLGAVTGGVGAFRDLVGLDRLPEDGLPDRLLLDDLRIARGEVVVPLLERHVGCRAAVRARRRLQAPGPEDVVAVGRVGQRRRRCDHRAGL